MANNLGSWGNSEMPPLPLFNETSKCCCSAAVQGVIPQPANGQGTPVQAQHQQIALVSLHAFDDRLHFVPPNKIGRQDYAFLLSGLLRGSAGLR
jgi:hypothetical protein